MHCGLWPWFSKRNSVEEQRMRCEPSDPPPKIACCSRFTGSFIALKTVSNAERCCHKVSFHGTAQCSVDPPGGIRATRANNRIRYRIRRSVTPFHTQCDMYRTRQGVTFQSWYDTSPRDPINGKTRCYNDRAAAGPSRLRLTIHCTGRPQRASCNPIESILKGQRCHESTFHYYGAGGASSSRCCRLGQRPGYLTEPALCGLGHQASACSLHHSLS